MNKSHSSAITKIILLVTLLLPSTCFAEELGLYLPGISYHIGANSSHPAYKNAPRKLDKNGAFVFNPGIGIGYDFRDKEDGSSLSFVLMGMTFRDCNDKATHTAGPGARYRYYFNDKISLDGELFLTIYLDRNWKTGKYNPLLAPFPSVGVNYHFETASLGFKTTFAPKNPNSSAARSFNVLFAYLYLGYSF